MLLLMVLELLLLLLLLQMLLLKMLLLVVVLGAQAHGQLDAIQLGQQAVGPRRRHCTARRVPAGH